MLLAVALCGLTFNVPRHWTARTERTDGDRRANAGCSVALRPPHYAKIVAESPWNLTDPPMQLQTFSSFEDAINGTYFFWDGDRLFAFGRSEEQATPIRVHRWSGWQARTWYRGYAKDGVELPNGEARVFSSYANRYVIRSGKRFVGLSCYEDLTLDCEIATRALLRSLR